MICLSLIVIFDSGIDGRVYGWMDGWIVIRASDTMQYDRLLNNIDCMVSRARVPSRLKLMMR